MNRQTVASLVRNRLTGILVALVLMAGIMQQPSAAHADGTFVVNSGADTNTRDSVLTLREAILVANGALNPATMTKAEQTQLGGCNFATSPVTSGVGDVFDRITFASGITQVSLRSSLPNLTDNGTWIDGS